MESSRTVAPVVTEPVGHDGARSVYPDLILQERDRYSDTSEKHPSFQRSNFQDSSRVLGCAPTSARMVGPDLQKVEETRGRCKVCKKSCCTCGRIENSISEDEFSGVKRNGDSIAVTFDDPMFSTGDKLKQTDLLGNEGKNPKLGRKWKHFQGKNNFYFDGRLMTAPSIKFCTMSFLLITVTFTLFMVSDAAFFTKRLTIGIPITGTVLFILVIVNMLKTTCSDPGILPRASAQEADFIEKCYATGNGVRPPPRTKDIVVNGQTIKSKYCFTCKMFRPPRASHCSVCDNCVDRFDHHCPFLGNCIGKRNYRNFYAFIVCLSLLAVFVLSFSITKLAMLGKDYGNLLDALRISPTSAIVIVVSFFGMWTVIGLAGFHTYLIAVEQTTNEDIKGMFGRANTVNPYSKGNVCQNCCFILCGPHHPSLIDPRGQVTSEFLASLPKKHGGNNDVSVIVQNQTTSIQQHVLLNDPSVHSPQTPHGMSLTQNMGTYNVGTTSLTSNVSISHIPKAGTIPGEPKVNISTSSVVGTVSTNESAHLWAPKLKAKSTSSQSTAKVSYTNPHHGQIINDEQLQSDRLVELNYLQSVQRSAASLVNHQASSSNLSSNPQTNNINSATSISTISDCKKSTKGKPTGKGPLPKQNLLPVVAVNTLISPEDVSTAKLEKFTMINAPMDLDTIS